MDLAYVQDMKIASAESAQMGAALASAPSSGGGNGPPLGQEQLQAMRAGAAAKMDAVRVEVNSDSFNPGSVSRRVGSSGANDLYDAYTVTFTVSAPGVVENAHAVLILEVLSPTTPNVPLQTVMLRNLPKLTPEPRKVTLEQRGLPEGFAVNSVAVHIFANGRELASNLSTQSLAVTRDEAHQFLVIRYTLDHKNESLAAALIPDLVSSVPAERLPAAELGRRIEVQVNRDGKVERASLDPELASGLATLVGDLVNRACFYPALHKGQAVAAPITLTLADFVQRDVAQGIAAGD
jgi:hypothetical protein